MGSAPQRHQVPPSALGLRAHAKSPLTALWNIRMNHLCQNRIGLRKLTLFVVVIAFGSFTTVFRSPPESRLGQHVSKTGPTTGAHFSHNMFSDVPLCSYADLPPHVVRCLVLSDTHGHHDELPPLPDGDILIHLGDSANRGSLSDIRSFARYLEREKFEKERVIVLQGNHDIDLRNPYRIDLKRELGSVATVLLDETAVVPVPHKTSLRIFGAAWDTCLRDDFGAGSPVDRMMATPVDLFLSHAPPRVRRAPDRAAWHNRNRELRDVVDRHGVLAHLSGHVHYARGVELHDNRRALCVNCATAQYLYPVILDYDTQERRIVNLKF